MTESRNALDVPAVLDRFTRSGRLLEEATHRVQELGDAANSATENSAALRDAATSLTATARSMQEVLTTLQGAQEAVRDAMTVARDFLDATDISAVRETLQRLEERVAGLEQGAAGTADAVTRAGMTQEQRLGQLFAAVDRSARLEQERNAAQQQLAALIEQIPPRTAKKMGLPAR